MCVCRGAGRLMNHGCWFGCNDAAAEMSLTEMETLRPYLHQLHESLNVHRFVSELLYESFLWLGWNMNSDQISVKKKHDDLCELSSACHCHRFSLFLLLPILGDLDSLLFGTNYEHYRWPVMVFPESAVCVCQRTV